MTISAFDLFSIGIGPSSSHTVGPWRAAARFATLLAEEELLSRVAGIRVELFGSLAATGRGHGTLPAVMLGLEGHDVETIDPDEKDDRVARWRASGRIRLPGGPTLPLAEDDIVLTHRMLPEHPNALTLTAFDASGEVLASRTYYSVGGGFVVEDGAAPVRDVTSGGTGVGFHSAAELLDRASEDAGGIAGVMLGVEVAGGRTASAVRARLLAIRDAMRGSAERGMTRSGTLPGGLEVRRRAAEWFARLREEDPGRDPAFALDWVDLVALAVNEENASGGRVVTAPTNGAAGIIPAVLDYALHYTPAGLASPDDAAVRFLLTAAAIGSIIKECASISGAEVGCQGEVGSAASMAAAGLAAVLGGTPAQVENAAEIAMEHSLGLTCDPIGGLVQIPCIERNAISAGKAVNAARMALRGDGAHHVSLDQVIETMRLTGADMHSKYKETARGGLALTVGVHVVEC
ncbi:L-serine ammonia-lyase [Cnuibacter physcomitrellae]|uniref:L-serine ammonia-lyase n=1 Tax=Cnuibacter physcomitrellae TaxID=1619308 RepID=UPI002175E499|nr:L-serine ammonia-lyase [Cnuibacter physcomitrellae]MCS5495994.1 L-serine ammonia-lyase [Cnuibacter physcomitrellae]